jgi:hypothetical protein
MSSALAALSSWAWPAAAAAPKAAQRTKMAATYEALLSGAPVAGHTPVTPRDVLRDDWAPPRFWDEMLLLKVRAARARAQRPACASAAQREWLFPKAKALSRPPCRAPPPEARGRRAG